MKIKSLALLLTSLIPNASFADGVWTAGLIADGDQSPYIGGDDSVDLLPYLAFETDRFHIGIDGISFDVIDHDTFSLEAFLDPRFAPDFPDTALFEGLDRDTAFEVGMRATYSFGAMYASASLQGDVTGAHDGFEGQVALGYEVELGPVMLDATAGFQLRDANLNNYLYGVSAAEVTAERALFEMGNTVAPFAEVTAIMPIGERTFLLGQVNFLDLGGAVDSPLVIQDRQVSLTLGIGFQF